MFRCTRTHSPHPHQWPGHSFPHQLYLTVCSRCTCVPVHTRHILLPGLATRSLTVCSYCTCVSVHTRFILLPARPYTADITRTFPASGVFEARRRDIYNAVLHVQNDAISAMAPGVHWRVLGGAVQFEPVQPTLEAPKSELLGPENETVLSNYAFKFNLRRYRRGGAPRWGRYRRSSIWGWCGATRRTRWRQGLADIAHHVIWMAFNSVVRMPLHLS